MMHNTQAKAAKLLAAAQASGTVGKLYGNAHNLELGRKEKQKEAKALVAMAEARIGQDYYGAAQLCLQQAMRIVFTLLTDFSSIKLAQAVENQAQSHSNSSIQNGAVAAALQEDTIGDTIAALRESTIQRHNTAVSAIFDITPDPHEEHQRLQQRLKDQEDQEARMLALPGIPMDSDHPPPPSTPHPTAVILHDPAMATELSKTKGSNSSGNPRPDPCVHMGFMRDLRRAVDRLLIWVSGMIDLFVATNVVVVIECCHDG